MPSSLAIPEPVKVNQEISPTERPTLLIVDDEEGPRQSLRVVFKDDYDLLLASSGEEALSSELKIIEYRSGHKR